ncbi:uncharacterized protein BDZ99DRAFT_527477 [Mytilinidion resinicola]|uniref:Uncharacterized protein n=1 Tax=Mytilinidion resinicola TaxID=574789 RepID=A0A6A6Y0X0_9PEZI|nr:uncharacterized protein BDZ99DRAFT_527477 [Mytilinidion resinicola]KAF2802451.1 hypothetical protein BDZ99DRAFT_527477 [Mytilinidion resinicola]
MPKSLAPRDKQALLILAAAITTATLLIAYSASKPPTTPQPTTPAAPRKQYNKPKQRERNQTLSGAPRAAPSRRAEGSTRASIEKEAVLEKPPKAEAVQERLVLPSHPPPGSPPEPLSPNTERCLAYLSQAHNNPISEEMTPRSTPSAGPSSPRDSTAVAIDRTIAGAPSGLLARQTFVSAGSCVMASELIRRLGEIEKEQEALRVEEGYDEGYEGKKEGARSPVVTYLQRRRRRREG